ncbi:triacylglycerol lipase OBL1-like [Corylus avellana]|uniref:triacylglycerol lipase OBL1-like n=1 Tax=Corylus avellana TaxID=13451 RepID=UPI001E22A810|nr:triacylglycerol lipase OBL1-like [Corylus avellana]XP_059457603.1 triacylglycerol lipase OBL1-like [Corylus avellana]
MASVACDKGFSSSHFLLKPEEVRFLDLIRILFSSDIENRDFVDTSEGKEESFRRRWLIFVSILAQKFLLFVAKPLEAIGSVIEMWLNLVICNRNIGVLLLNLIRGRLVKPDKTSATFLSFIGNLDKRVELDSSIKCGDGRYNAALAMMASKASYENKSYLETTVNDHWKMEFLDCYDFWNEYQEKPTTQAFMLRDKNADHDTIVVAFRGTEPFDSDAWCSDFDISWYGIRDVGKMHGGFMKALGLQKNLGWPKEVEQNDSRPALAYYAIREKLKELVQENDKATYILTGHSLGGALAILFPAILLMHDEKLLLERLGGVYTFGQPRVGDEKFGEFMEKKLKDYNIRYFRFVYSNDMVARLPYDDKTLMFKHFGTCLYYNRAYKGKIVAEEPNKNYFSPLGAIPMMINAFWELIRSFTIKYKKGPEYRESSLLKIFRLIGLVMPGVPAHCPQDYVNATRLGSSDLFLPPKEPENQHQIIMTTTV